MRTRIFVDTSALYALADIDDEHHEEAKRYYEEYLEKDSIFFLSDQILAETATLIRRRLGYAPSRDFLSLVNEGCRTGLFEMIYSDDSLIGRASEIFLKLSDPKFSFVDALSISIMRKERIKVCFAFDRHFTDLGFKME